MEFIFNILFTAMELYSYGLIVYIFMSWFPQARETKFGQFLSAICEPYLEPFRRIIPPLGMIDFSPIVAFLALDFARLGLSALANQFLF